MDRHIEKTYSKIFDSASNLLIWNSDLPKTVGKLDIRLNKKEISRLKMPLCPARSYLIN